MGFKDRLRDVPVVGVAIAVQERYGGDRAGYLAAVVAYYGFLSLFPLLLLGFSVVGFVLAGRPDLQGEMFDALVSAVPGLARVLGENLDALVQARAASGLIGLAGLLWTGLRASEAAGFAVSRIFRVEPYQSFAKKKGWAIGTTVGLGLLALASLAVVAVVGSLSAGGPAGALLAVGGVALAAGLDVALFLVAYRVLTQRQGPPFSLLWKGALLGGLGWTALKVLGAWYVARVISGSSAVYGTLVGAVAILLLLYLASQLLLYGAQLNAVMIERGGGTLGPVVGPFVDLAGDDRMEGDDRMMRNGDRSTGELMRSIAGDTAALVRKEVQLARQEIVEGVMSKVIGAGAFAVAGVFAVIALVMFGITLGVSLDIVLPAWLAWLLTAVAFLLLAGLAAVVGKGMMKRKSIAPEETKRTVKEDVEWARTQLKR